jgi:adenylate kinase family enzyme
MASSHKEEINQKEINEKENPSEIKDENDITTKKKYKSKFNLLEQGRLMLIGNMEEVSKNLIIVGPKSSGKSSIFSLLTTGSPNNYTDSGTCGINFGFMRTQNSSQKKVMNVYEIGSGIENLILIKTILNNENFESTFLFIVLDFESPHNQLSYLIKYIANLHKIINEIIDRDTIESCIKNRISQYSSNRPPDMVNVFPMETFLIGNKYDLLETIDIEKLKWLCPSLRFFSFINAFNLIFYSSKKKETINSLYNTMVEYAFSSGKKDNLKKYFQKNSTKPLYINYYNDSLDEIGEPKIPVTVSRDIEQRWKETYDGLFKNIKKNEENNANINLDENFYQLYKEPKIDRELKLFNDFKESNEINQKMNMNNNINKKVSMDAFNKSRRKKNKF